MKWNANTVLGFFTIIFMSVSCSEKPETNTVQEVPAVESTKTSTVQLNLESLQYITLDSIAVARGILPLTLRSPGRISVNVNQTAKVTSTFEGRISSLNYDIGSVVYKEDVMGLIDSPELLNKPLELKAPISGQVIERHGTVGESVDKAKELYTISDLDHLWCIAEIKEKDIASLQLGQRADISVLAYPKEKFTGKIVLIGHEVEEKTRTLEVRIEVERHSGKLKPGMFAEIELITRILDNVLVIPDESLQTLDNEQIVFISVGNHQYEKRVVTIGREQGGLSEITSGLNVGDVVVTKGSFILKSELLKGELGEE